MDLSHIRFSGTPATLLSRQSSSRHMTSGSVARRPLNSAAAVGTRAAVAGLAAAVLRHADLDPAAYRTAPLARRVPACLRALGVTTESAAVAAMASSVDMQRRALSALLLGVTGFFRDAEVFALLEQQVLPLVFRLERPLRVLSVGCATGAELYSIAMLLDEAGRLDGATLCGLDGNATAIAAARAGVFAAPALTGLNAERRERHFAPAAGGARIAARLRQHTHWHAGDATRELPAGAWDVVLCRNLIIYLQPHACDQLYAALRAALAPGGVLVLGRAERPFRALALTSLGRGVHHADAD